MPRTKVVARISTGGKAPRKHVPNMHTDGDDDPVEVVPCVPWVVEKKLPLVQYSDAYEVENIVASVSQFVATISRHGTIVVHTWSGDRSVTLDGFLGGLCLDRSDSRQVLALKHIGDDDEFAGHAQLCSIDAVGLLRRSDVADDDEDDAAPTVLVRSLPFARGVHKRAARDCGVFPTSIAQIPGFTVALTFDGALWFFDESDHTRAPNMLAVFAEFDAEPQQLQTAFLAAHDDRLFVSTDRCLVVVRERVVEFALCMPDLPQYFYLGTARLAVSPDGQCVVVASKCGDLPAVIVFDVVYVTERVQSLPWRLDAS
jgi:hypothetical protein